eukprot:1158467-Pelagomonas_calceolata.AAC.7
MFGSRVQNSSREGGSHVLVAMFLIESVQLSVKRPGLPRASGAAGAPRTWPHAHVWEAASRTLLIQIL